MVPPMNNSFAPLFNLNNDNNMDIAVSDNSNLTVFLGIGNGMFSSPSTYNSVSNPWDLEVFDMNDDGYNDILAGNGSGSYFYIHYNDSSGNFLNRSTIIPSKPAWYLSVCDFNSDAYPDIAAGSGSYEYDNVFVIVGDSAGNYTNADTSSPCGYVRDISVGDLNNNSETDILVVDDNGMYGVLGNGTNKFVSVDTIVNDPGNFNAKLVHTADLNADNKVDLIIGRANKISIYYNTGTVNFIDNITNTANSFELHQNYPNPFNPKTIISYQLQDVGNVELSVFNLLGQKVATLVSEKQFAGNYKIEWTPAHLPSSIYFYKLKTKNGVQIKKMQLIK